MRILLTGGCGYIGSHTALALAAAGHQPILFDNLANSTPDVAERVATLAGCPVPLVVGDVRDQAAVRAVLGDHGIEAVIHFAALKAVAESVADPLAYHANNVGGLLSLLEAMEQAPVRTLVFSSSATVYGEPHYLPIDEAHPTRAVNPYGQTKHICETILADLAAADRGWRVSVLRYFNPVGAHPAGLIGDDPAGVPNNLMPLLTRAASGKLAALAIYGSDYATEDGTAVRDYVHVMDLAEGHVAALAGVAAGDPLQVYNLGTGRGTSVRELVTTFAAVTGVAVPHHFAPRRPGDASAVYAAVDKAARELKWRATRTTADMCLDSWRFARSRS